MSPSFLILFSRAMRPQANNDLWKCLLLQRRVLASRRNRHPKGIWPNLPFPRISAIALLYVVWMPGYGCKSPLKWRTLSRQRWHALRADELSRILFGFLRLRTIEARHTCRCWSQGSSGWLGCRREAHCCQIWHGIVCTEPRGFISQEACV